jgi:hypothetical protein
MSVESTNGAGVVNSCTDLIPYVPREEALGLVNVPLLEGCPLPVGLQELVICHLNYESEFEPFDPNNPLSMFQENLKSYGVTRIVEPGVATINSLCNRAAGKHLGKITTLRHRFNTHMCLAPVQMHRELYPEVYPCDFKFGGCGLSPGRTLELCENPERIAVVGMTYSDEELQQTLRKINALEVVVGNCDQLRHISLQLPTVEKLRIIGTTFHTLDLRKCPKLKLLDCSSEGGVHPIKVDVRGLKCVVTAFNLHGVSLLATDDEGREISVQGCYLLNFPSLDNKPNSADGS